MNFNLSLFLAFVPLFEIIFFIIIGIICSKIYKNKNKK